MKRVVRSRIQLLLSLVFFSVLGARVDSGKTFFKPRALSNDATYELALHNYSTYHMNPIDNPYEHPKHNTSLRFQKSIFYQEATNHRDLARFFLFNNKTSLRTHVSGSSVVGVDIDSDWLNLSSTQNLFDANFSINPRHESWGRIFKYRHDLSMLCEGLYMSISVPFLYVMHDLRLTSSEVVSSNEKDALGNTLVTVSDALRQETWSYGKFSNNKQKKSAIDDIELKLGWTFYRREQAHLGFYGSVLFPFADRPSAEYVFEPLIGNGGHWGLGLGLNTDARIWGGHKHNISFAIDAKYQYLFAGTEMRSFDLTNGPWTRYLQVVKSNVLTTELPAINFFTREMKVRSHGQLEVFAALHGQYSSFNFEVGYNLWWRDSEKISLKRAWDPAVEDIGITDFNGGSASNATIAAVGSSDATFTRIQASRINLNSAANASALTHKFFIATSADYRSLDLPATVGFGLSYEVARDNNAFDNWAMWLTGAVSF